jgi:4-amino-4-deoxy-L-arabinose transferase-like glycosyltransferase
MKTHKIFIANPISIFTGLLLFSLLVRLIYFTFVMGGSAPLQGDEPDYHRYAESFIQGQGWQINGLLAQRPPLTSVLLLPGYFLTDANIITGRLTMILASSFGSPLLYLLMHSYLGIGLMTSLGAAMVWSLYPTSGFYSPLLLTENVSVPLLLAMAIFLLKALQTGKHKPACMAGLFLGFATMARSSFLYLPLFILFGDLVLRKWRKPSLTAIQWTWLIICFLLILAPWTVRNYLRLNVFLPTESRLGWGLFMCNGSLGSEQIQKGNYYKDPVKLNSIPPDLSETERDRALQSIALREMRDHWRLLPRPILNRFINFWTFRPNPYKETYTVNDYLMASIWIPILILFALSFRYFSWRNDWPLLLTILYAVLTTLPFWGEPRFRHPIEPFIVARAVIAVSMIIRPNLIRCR